MVNLDLSQKKQYYSNEVIVCHHKLSFHITMTLMSFQDPTVILQNVSYYLFVFISTDEVENLSGCCKVSSSSIVNRVLKNDQHSSLIFACDFMAHL